jgi:hypothetical protein
MVHLESVIIHRRSGAGRLTSIVFESSDSVSPDIVPVSTLDDVQIKVRHLDGGILPLGVPLAVGNKK